MRPLPRVELRQLQSSDAPALFRLVQDNRDHLTTFGDFAEMVEQPLDSLVRELCDAAYAHLRFGILEDGNLVGRVDLVPVDPPRYGLGYWLSGDATGRGLATAAIRKVIDLAANTLRASDIYAGVTRGNLRSQKLLERCGFAAIESFERYTRFHLGLRDGDPTDASVISSQR